MSIYTNISKYELIDKKLEEIRNNKSESFDFVDAFNLHTQEVFEEYSSDQKGMAKTYFLKYLSQIPIFFAEKIFESSLQTKGEYLSYEKFSEPFKTIKCSKAHEIVKLIFNILDFDSNGFTLFQDIKLIVSIIPNSHKKDFLNIIGQDKSIEDLELMTLNPFSMNTKISFSEFQEIVFFIEEGELLILLVFSYLYETIPIFRKSLALYSIRNRSSGSVISLEDPSPTRSRSNSNSSRNIHYIEVNEKDIYLKPRKLTTSSYGQARSSLPLQKPVRKAKSKFIECNVIDLLETKDENSLFKTDSIVSIGEEGSFISISNEQEGCNNLKLKKKETSGSIRMELNYFADSATVENIYISSNEGSDVDEKSHDFEKFVDDYQMTKIQQRDLEELCKSILHEGELFFLEESAIEILTENSSVDSKDASKEFTSEIKEQKENKEFKESSKNSTLEKPKSKESSKEKKRKLSKLLTLKSQHVVLIDKNLYFYDDIESKENFNYNTTHSLQGCFIKNNQKQVVNGQSYFSFTLFYQNNKTNTFYHKDNSVNSSWVKIIRDSINYKNIFDHYSVISEIGSGSFGKVYYSKEIYSQEEFAIKIIDKNSKNTWELMKNEIDIMKITKHRNIVKFIDSYENSNYTFIVMEYLKHGSLSTYLYRKNFKLKEKVIAKVAKQVAEALYYLHKIGILHRDLKPENILISSKRDHDLYIKLTDFGLSKILSENENTKEGCGTLAFSAPELLARKSYDGNIDIWSLGVNIYFMLTGEVPFPKTKDPKDYYKNLKKELVFSKKFCTYSEEAKDIIKQCLVFDPTKRIPINELVDHPWFRV